MLATFAFDVCHDVYLAAREAIDCKIPTLNAEASGRYLWRPDRMPRLAEYVCDFALAGERALGVDSGGKILAGRRVEHGRDQRDRGSHRVIEGNFSCGLGETSPSPSLFETRPSVPAFRASPSQTTFRASPSQTTFRASRLAMFRLYYLGGAEFQVARRHMGISEFTWADWAEEIRGRVGRELTRVGLFPPARYFREATEKAS